MWLIGSYSGGVVTNMNLFRVKINGLKVTGIVFAAVKIKIILKRIETFLGGQN